MVSQLIDYSGIYIKKGSTLSLLPIISSDKNETEESKYLTAMLMMSFTKKENFMVVERENLSKILMESLYQESGLLSDENKQELGKLMSAEYICLGSIYKKNNKTELLVRLVKVSTGEILSMTKAKFDKEFDV